VQTPIDKYTVYNPIEGLADNCCTRTGWNEGEKKKKEKRRRKPSLYSKRERRNTRKKMRLSYRYRAIYYSIQNKTEKKAKV
jgi:hypothetical protein